MDVRGVADMKELGLHAEWAVFTVQGYVEGLHMDKRLTLRLA